MERVMIDPLVRSARHVMATMLHLELDVRDGEGPLLPSADVCAMVELSGDLTGTVALECPRSTAVRMVERMTGLELGAGSPMVTDAVGELVGMIATGARSWAGVKRVVVSCPAYRMPGAEWSQNAERVVCSTSCGDLVLGGVLRGATIGSR